jgi:hypothetical protein
MSRSERAGSGFLFAKIIEQPLGLDSPVLQRAAVTFLSVYILCFFADGLHYVPCPIIK